MIAKRRVWLILVMTGFLAVGIAQAMAAQDAPKSGRNENNPMDAG